MEKEIKITQCDVCGRETNSSYEMLLSYSNWTKYKIYKDWKEGIHKGEIECEIIVCDNCDNKKGIKYFFFKILKPFYNKIINGDFENA